MEVLRRLSPGNKLSENLEPWRTKFVDMFLDTGMSVAGGFGAAMKPETIEMMRQQISGMVADLPIEQAREMLQLSILQATSVLQLMPPPEEFTPNVVDDAPEKEVQLVD